MRLEEIANANPLRPEQRVVDGPVEGAISRFGVGSSAVSATDGSGCGFEQVVRQLHQDMKEFGQEMAVLIQR